MPNAIPKTSKNPRGAGRHAADPKFKKEPVNTKLSFWLREKMRADDEPISVMIERSVIKVKGWRPPT